MLRSPNPETHRAILVLQKRTNDGAALQQDGAAPARVLLAAFILEIQQLVGRQHKPARFPVMNQVTLEAGLDRVNPFNWIGFRLALALNHPVTESHPFHQESFS